MAFVTETDARIDRERMHNAGLFDEYKDVAIEVDPKDNNLSTVG